VIAVIAALAVLGAPTAAQAQDPAPDQDVSPQGLFGDVIARDERTTTAVKRLLASGAGFVSPRAFADLTADGKEDAVVTVATPGAAGAVAGYVLSADGSGSGRLRVVFSSQTEYRLRMSLEGVTLTLAVPEWRRSDDLCCPSRVRERDYAWSTGARRFVRRAVRTVRR
jgi:hypothetical protein